MFQFVGLSWYFLEMADIASETALQHLKSLYPYGETTSSSDGSSYKFLVMMGISAQCNLPVLQNPWYTVAAVSFTNANRPEAVPLLYKHVLGELELAQNRFNVPAPEANREKLLITRKFRDAIFKACLAGGIPKVY
jgi:hypothetical protein